MPRKLRKAKQKTLLKRQPREANQMVVKRDFEFKLQAKRPENSKEILGKKVDNSFYSLNASFALKDLAKTLVISLFLFSLELVLYFAWFK